MKFEKSPAWLVQLFEALAPGERRKMFGYPCSFERGQLFCGLFADGLFVRLGDAERAELLAAPGARRFEPMPGRPMREYVVLPAAMLEDEAAVERWMQRAQEFARGLPEKKKAGGVRKAAASGKPAVARKAAAEKAPTAKKARRGSRSPSAARR
jgi:TfoX/Sxy family transcriptional regulator of competence genes